MPNLTVDIANGFYQSNSLPFSNQRCVNLYPEIPQAPALTQSALFNTDGLFEVINTGRKSSDKNRGAWVFQNTAYFINGQRLYKVERSELFDGSVEYRSSQVGDIEGLGLCSIADNGSQLMIINDEGTGYIYQPDTSPQFQVIDDPAFTANGKPEYVEFVDSYFVVTTDQDVAIISAPNDGLNWNALDFVSAEADPDGVVAPLVLKNQLFILGRKTTEAYQNIGGAGVPFQRINGLVFSKGCCAPHSVINVGDMAFWLGNGSNEKPQILAFNGSTIQKISTSAIDEKIQETNTGLIKYSFSWAYSKRGHDFVGFNFGDYCFVYDIATQRWHERVSDVRDARGVRFSKRCRINSVITVYNVILAGDSEDGRIGVLDSNTYKEYDEPINSFFTTSPMYDTGNSFSLPYIELLCETGVGNSDIQNPKVRLEISRDGVQFENPRTRELGKIGNRSNRVVWHKNGRFSQMAVFKVTVSDAVRRRFYGMVMQMKRGVKGA